MLLLFIFSGSLLFICSDKEKSICVGVTESVPRGEEAQKIEDGTKQWNKVLSGIFIQYWYIHT